MANESLSKVPNRSGSTGQALGRREMVRRVLGGAGLGYAAPLIAASHPIHKHLADVGMLAEADAQASAANWKPVFLDAHQSATLRALAEAIVPGSGEAKVTPFVDLLLSVDTQENQKKFLAALGAFEAESIRRYQRPYTDLSESQQNEVLTVASTSASRDKENAKPDAKDLHSHFENIKGWVSGAYYSSEMGMKELGWTGQVIFASFPGCDHPEGHN